MKDSFRNYREMGFNQQAIYCFRKILSIDPFDMDALWDRSYLLALAGDYRRVRNFRI
jgi:general transcription factor 3C polypeptide 3 (transcription factor C subunit 4)